jgi:hypothetical protein
MSNKDSIAIFHILAKFDVTAEHFFGFVVMSVRVAEQKICTLYSKTERKILKFQVCVTVHH